MIKKPKRRVVLRRRVPEAAITRSLAREPAWPASRAAARSVPERLTVGSPFASQKQPPIGLRPSAGHAAPRSIKGAQRALEKSHHRGCEKSSFCIHPLPQPSHADIVLDHGVELTGIGVHRVEVTEKGRRRTAPGTIPGLADLRPAFRRPFKQPRVGPYEAWRLASPPFAEVP
jgi:hypothetical protein